MPPRWWRSSGRTAAASPPSYAAWAVYSTRAQALCCSTTAISTAPARKRVARTLAVLTQTSEGVPDLTVEELVWRGRYPHHTWFQGATRRDGEWSNAPSSSAICVTCGVADWRSCRAGSSSVPGWRWPWPRSRRCSSWTSPPAFLDYYHQLEVMDLLADLNRHGPHHRHGHARPEPGRALRRAG